MSRRAPPLLLATALVFGALELGTGWIEPYGLFHDEVYYWVGAKRLLLGYVDHPPLAPWLLAGCTALLGDGRLAFGLVPALCFAGTILLAGRMAQRFGAGAFGQVLAGLSIGVMPFNLVFFSFYSVNALEILLWTACTFLIVELLRTGNDRLWIGVGVIAGVGLLNKHTFALLAAGIFLGILATTARSHLRSRWLWAGVAVAIVLALPNLVWNAQHGWPSLAFYRSRPAIDLPATFGDAVEIQVVGANPANVLVWLPGVVVLLASRRLRAWRPLGIAFSALLVVILLSGQRRGDRIAGIYPVVLAAGATFWDGWRGRGHRPLRVALVGSLLGFGALVLPATLPILPPRDVGAYLDALGERAEIETHDVGESIPLYLRGRIEWERFADEVIAAWQALPAGERERAVVLAPHWVFASVIEYYGRDRALPPVVSPHNAYWFWRADAAGRDVALTVYIPRDALARFFAETREVALFRCESCTGFVRDMPILVSTGPVRPLEALLDEWRHFGIEAAPQLRERRAP